jgi:DNA polymerase
MRSRRPIDTGHPLLAGSRVLARSKRTRKPTRGTGRASPARLALTPSQRRSKRATKTIAKANAETSATLKAGSGAQKPLTVKTLEDLAKRIRICVKCPLHASRTLAVPGEGKASAKVMIVGEGPGKQEDQTGRPFVGNAGRYLDHVLEGTPFTREDFFITNIVKCRPPSNRTPTADEAETCTSLYLFHQVKLLNPRLILLLGSTAVKRMLGLKSVEEARGKVIERDGRKYLASYHPAVRFYREDLAQKIKEDFGLLKAELAKL